MVRRIFVAAVLVGLLTALSTLRTLPDVSADGAVFVVNSTGFHTDIDTDDGECDTGVDLVDGSDQCTLEAAIAQANATPGKDFIHFNIPESDVGFDPSTSSFNILISSADPLDTSASLPTITSPVVIDGYTQPGSSPNTLADGNNAVLKINVDGSLLSDFNAAGFDIVSGDSVIRGLAISEFGQQNIYMRSGGGNIIEGNFIGTDITGEIASNETNYGVEIQNSPSNRIGGTTPESRNVISGHEINGLVIGNTGSTDNVVQGNFIGTDKDGLTSLPNGSDGVLISAVIGTSEMPSGNIIGGAVDGARNVISGNGYAGVEIWAGTGNEIQGNFIGVDVTGAAPLANSIDGVLIANPTSTFNVVGGTDPFALNVISGNTKRGVRIDDGATNNTVLGNFIGTNRDGDAGIPNLEQGVAIIDAPGNTIGGTTDAGFNLISGNGDDGIAISGKASSGNKVLTNVIGTNLISDNPVANGRHGILIINAPNNLIGDLNAPPLTISGNTDDGVHITGEEAKGNKVVNSFIGLDFGGLDTIPNGKAGVTVIGGASENIIGEASDQRQNVISGNNEAGVLITGASTAKNVVQGNFIGTDLDGLNPLGNETGVILRDGAHDNKIGANSTLPTSGTNVISGHIDNGVELINAGDDNIVQGNFIGTDKNESCVLDGDGGCPLGNGGYGIYVENTSNTIIGGSLSSTKLNDGNVVAYNGRNLNWKGHGIVIESGEHNTMRFNLMHHNHGRAIDLVRPDGPPDAVDVLHVDQYAFTVNDYLDLDDGGNGLTNYPVVTKVSFGLPFNTIEWTMIGDPVETYVIDVFANSELDRSGFGEGEVYVETFTITTDGDGLGKATRSYVPLLFNISATATHPNGDTSEFSMIDTDGDAIANAWETNAEDFGGIDVDEDGFFDIVMAPVATPFHKDMFIEIDSMTGREPSFDALDMVEIGRETAPGSGVRRDDEGFDSAPASLVQNPDLTGGINIHLEKDESNLPRKRWPASRNLAWKEFDKLKKTHFGDPTEQGNPKALAAKQLVYRYAIFADRLIGNTQSGWAEIGGNDFFMTLGGWSTPGGTDEQQAGTFMHELGHTLNLLHGGGQDLNCKPNYHSVMNYIWQTPHANAAYNSSWVLDYSRRVHHEGAGGFINENSLSEPAGFDGTTGYVVPIGPIFDSMGNKQKAMLVPERGPVELNNEVPPDLVDLGVKRDVNFIQTDCIDDSTGDGVINNADSTFDTQLRGHEDWSNIRYYFIGTSDFVEGSHQDLSDLPADQEFAEGLDSLGTGPGTLQFSHIVFEDFEDIGTAVIRVTRQDGTDGAVTVDFDTSNGTADAIDDYIHVFGTLTFEDGEFLKTFEIPIVLDDLDEGTETVNLSLSNPTGGAALGDPIAVQLNILDDLSPGAFEFSEAFFGGSETGGEALVTVRRVNGKSGPATVTLTTSNGTAEAGSDYTPATFVFPFANNETVASLIIPIADDSDIEGTETFMVKLSDPTGGTALGGTTMAQVNIVDNDDPLQSFIVATPSSQGIGSLRQAIDDANNNPGHDLITFDIPGAGVQTIALDLALPIIEDAVTIDAYTQPGASPNTLADGSDAVILIELDGTNAQRLTGEQFANGFQVESDNVTIRGFSIHSFGGFGIELTKGSNPVPFEGLVVEGNHIGTDATGTLAGLGNSLGGMDIVNVGNVRIGGTDPAARNVISGNDRDGIRTSFFDSDNLAIQGSYIGTQADGVSPLGNGREGLVIAGQGFLIGGDVPGAGNIIAFNTNDGIALFNSTETEGLVIRSNSIYSNGEMGIDWGGASSSSGPDLNDPRDALSALRQNFPVLESASSIDGTTTIEARLSSIPNKEFYIEFFETPEIDGLGHGEGKTPIGSTNVATDANGDASFAVELPISLPKGAFITSTATRNEPDGNTSEFSARVAVGEELSNIMVVNTANDLDDGICDESHCSLREAIFAANNHPGKDTVVFDIAPGGVQTIDLNTILPVIVDPVILDGTTQPGYAGTPIIELNGDTAFQVGPTFPPDGVLIGLHLATNDSVIRGFVLNRFHGDGIFIGTLQTLNFGGNVVEGNYVGTDVSGQTDLGNQGTGIVVRNSSNNRIGGSTPETRNIVSGNARGIILDAAEIFDQGNFVAHQGSSNLIEGNFVGTDVTGTQPLGNNNIGITVDGPGAIIRNNVVGANGGRGLDVNAPLEGDPTVIQGNHIGTDVTGTTALGNGSNGIEVRGFASLGAEFGPNVIVGGDRPEDRNVISANDGLGVFIQTDNDGSITAVRRNYIGTDITGTQALGNTGGGVQIFGTGNFVERNLISGNAGFGVHISGRFTADNVVQGNHIGTQADGVSPLGNTGEAVEVRQGSITFLTELGAHDNIIGGTEEGQGNVIAYNGGNGISAGDFTLGSSFLSNSIFDNSGLGIELGKDGTFANRTFISDGPTPNDANDADTGPNDLTNFPLILSAESGTGITKITTVLQSLPNTQFKVQFFSNDSTDPSGFGEGKQLIGETSVTTDGGGIASFIITLAVELTSGQSVSATATDPNGNTSEFSESVEITGHAQQDGGNNVGSEASTGIVELIPLPSQPPVAEAGGPYVGDEGESLALDGSGSFDLDNSIVTYEWDFDTDGEFNDAVGETPSVTFDDNGSFVVSLRVTDETNETATDTADVTVNNVSPVVDAGSDQDINEGETISLDPATFTDAGILDTHTATIDWGDGTSDPGIVDQSAGTVSGTHTYTDDGFFIVSVCVTDNDGDTGCDSFGVTVDPIVPTEGADLSIDKSLFTQGPINDGDNIIWFLNISNIGPEEALNVLVEDDLPTGMNFVTAFPSQGSCFGVAGGVNCLLGNIPVGGGALVTLLTTAQFGGTFTNSVTVSSSTIDLDPDDNTASAEVFVQGESAADLRISKLGDKQFIAVGEEVTYEITVTNDGPGDATNVVVTDTLPAILEFVSASAECAENGGMVTCSLGDIPNGGTASVFINATGSEAGQATNFASVTSDTLDPATGNNTSGADTIIGIADLAITKVDLQDPVEPGATITYEVTATNLGPDAAQNVQVIDQPQPGIVVVDVSTSDGTCNNFGPFVRCDFTEIDPNESVVIIVELQAPNSEGFVFNSASVNSTSFDPIGDNNQAIEDTTIQEPGANTPPTVNIGGPYTVEEGGSILLDGTGSSDPDQDSSTLTYEWDLDGDGLFDDSDSATPTFDAFDLDGPFFVSIALKVTDDQGESSEDDTEVEIVNAAPTVDAGGDQTIDLGEAANLAPATFNDPGIADTHTATIDWGDSTLEDGTVDQDNDTVSGSHTYGQIGQFTVQVCVTDDDGGTGCDSFSVLVVEPPADGEVVVDGQIEVIAIDNPPPGVTPAGGLFPITLTLRNNGSPLDNLFTRVTVLDYLSGHEPPPSVDNRIPGTPPDVGAELEISFDGDTFDNGEITQVTYQVRVPAIEQFRALVTFFTNTTP